MTDALTPVRLFAVFAAVLSAVAWCSPAPDRVTDRGLYEMTAAQVIVPDCSDLQCFRVLVPWALGRLPGSSDFRWKTYAVLSNAAAAVAVFALCLTFGLGRRAAVMAAAMSAFGFGSFYTLHDPFTSDPLMFLVGPLVTNQLLIGHFGIAAAVGIVGVLAKEFSAAPLYAFAALQAIHRRWDPAIRTLLAGNFAFLTWTTLTIGLMLKFNYSWGYGVIGSANVTGGAALALWMRDQSVRGMLSAMFNEFGALYVLAPVGLVLAPRRLRALALVSVPIAAIFCVVQQPDRGLWNFHYLVVPLGALVLERASEGLAWAVIGLFAFANLRIGAQLTFVPPARFALAGSTVLALAAVVMAMRRQPSGAAAVAVHEARP
jgi:hypothetical protein